MSSRDSQLIWMQQAVGGTTITHVVVRGGQMERVTLRFNSDNGAEYLYDDVTGSILPWGALEDALLDRERGVPPTEAQQTLIDLTPAAERDAKTNWIRRWRTHYGAFVRDADTPLVPATPEQLQKWIWNTCMVLLLFVSDTCNLRCSYCISSSGNYLYHKQQTGRKMTFELAKKAIDWFAKGVAPTLSRNPTKVYGLSLYGGEPLLNIELIDRVMDYCNQNYPGLFAAALTTNGLLLTPENVKVLVRHGIHVGVSLDGAESEHDRLRPDAGGRGTYKRILANLTRIKSEHPQFWATMTTLSVYDPKSPVDETASFLEAHRDLIPPSGFVNRAESMNTLYYDQFTEGDYQQLDRRLVSLRRRYKALTIADRPVDTYLSAITGRPVVHLTIRQRGADLKPFFLPYTGACVPGARMAISVDGDINMCERVNGTNPIGHLDRKGLNYARVAKIIEDYQRLVLSHCGGCPITRLCGLCFSHAETNGGIMNPPGYCDHARRMAKRDLSDYVSILEANGKAADEVMQFLSQVQKDFLFQG